MLVREVPPARRLRGEVNIPGDKSISHRAAILGLLAEGETRIQNFLKAGDCLNTLKACEQLGAGVRWEDETLVIRGCGLRGLKKPAGPIDCGNSGTGVRLLAGVLAGVDFGGPVEITGDEQVRRRPMNRVIEPLTKMGARIESEPGGLCPLRIQGGNLKGIDYASPVASAQVKSCILLAGLFAGGKTNVTEPSKSRDHTEIMLRYFGVKLLKYPIQKRMPDANSPTAHATKIGVQGGRSFSGKDIAIPSDISSAAFFIVAAGLLKGSELDIPGVGINPTRTELISILKQMGVSIAYVKKKKHAGESVADMKVASMVKPPQAIFYETSAERIPSLIDEIPILAVAATAIEQGLTIRNARELRVKETDRISVLTGELRRVGVKIDEFEDGMKIYGGKIIGGDADSHGDHRLAMSLAVAGLVSERGVSVHNPDCVNTSFPGFWELLDQAAER